MSVTTSYPGIYIQELPSNTHTIAAAPTSVTVFVGYVHPFQPDPPNFGTAIEIFSFSDYERLFGGFYQSQFIDANVSYAVNEFFENGGTDAFVVGLEPKSYFDKNGNVLGAVVQGTATFASVVSGISFISLVSTATENIGISIGNVRADASGNLTVADITVTQGAVAVTYGASSLNSSDPNFIGTLIALPSVLVTVSPDTAYPAAFSGATYAETETITGAASGATVALAAGAGDGITFTSTVSTTAQKITITIGNVQAVAGVFNVADVTVTQGPVTVKYAGVSLDSTKTNYLPTVINGFTANLASVAADNVYPAAYPSASFTTSGTFPAAAAGATTNLDTSTGGIVITALQPTDSVKMTVTINNFQADAKTGNLTIADLLVTYGAQTEVYRKISLNSASSNVNFIGTRINGVSALIEVSPNTTSPDTGYPAAFPAASYSESQTISTPAPSGTVGVFDAADFLAVFQEDSSLDKVPIFNLLLTPGITNNAVLSEALAFCERKLAFFIMDPPIEDVADPPTDWVGDFLQNSSGTGDTDGNVAPQSANGALYFPYLLSSNPVTGQPTTVTGAAFALPPSGYVAGVYAATDSSRGVWKAPAGLATTLLDTTGVVTPGGLMTDSRQGVLNLIGVNCIRTFPGAGTVVFGARTLVSSQPRLPAMDLCSDAAHGALS